MRGRRYFINSEATVITDFLLKLFVKDFKNNPENAAVRAKAGKLAGITGIVLNIILTLIKLTAGLLIGSVSVSADALNNLSDAAASVLTLLGFRLAQRPADKEHPFGHARYEYISGLTVSAIILLIGLQLAYASVNKIIRPSNVDFSAFTVFVLVFSVLVKIWLTVFFKKLGRKIKSPVLLASSVDSRNDVISTAAVLFGCILNYFTDINIDGYIGLAVSIFIICSGIKTAKETLSPLLGKQADRELAESISRFVTSHDKVLGMHDLLVHDYGPGQCYASVHVEISAELNPIDCHNIIDSIENDIMEKLNVHLVIHCDPVEEHNKEQNEMNEMLADIIRTLYPQFSMHDFRIVRDGNQNKLEFDLSVPYSMLDSRREIKNSIDKALMQRGKNYITAINFDGKD